LSLLHILLQQSAIKFCDCCCAGLCAPCAGKETDYESAKARLLEAQVAAEEAKAAAQAADDYTQSKQSLYNQALSARNAAKAAYDVAQQELRLVEQAAQNASALLVRMTGTALWAGEKLDRRQLLAADASRKVSTRALCRFACSCAISMDRQQDGCSV
jgi:hypothetical protein